MGEIELRPPETLETLETARDVILQKQRPETLETARDIRLQRQRHDTLETARDVSLRRQRPEALETAPQTDPQFPYHHKPMYLNSMTAQ